MTVFLAALSAAIPAAADDWPQWRGPNRDGVWHETGALESFPQSQICAKWSVEIGPGYSGPTVAHGRVYVTDRQVEPQQVERVHCFDAETGKPIWSYDYPCIYRNISYTAGPRAAVTLAAGRAFALGTMGHLHVLDAATGQLVWKRDLRADYQIRMPIWGIAAAPLVVGDVVILHIGGAEGACVVALDVNDGAEQWRALDDRASYAAPIMIRQAGKPVVVCWTGDHIAGLDPADGNVLWKSPMPPTRMPIGVATPTFGGGRLLVTSFYDGSKMLELDDRSPTARLLWEARGPDERRTQALHSIIATPLIIGDYAYGVDSYGELRCLDARSGQRIWENTTATPRARWSNIHMVLNGEKVWMFNERGQLIIARLSPEGYYEISRADLIEPTELQLPQRGGVCWAHPAFANLHVFVRNDERLLCASVAKDEG